MKTQSFQSKIINENLFCQIIRYGFVTNVKDKRKHFY